MGAWSHILNQIMTKVGMEMASVRIHWNWDPLAIHGVQFLSIPVFSANTVQTKATC